MTVVALSPVQLRRRRKSSPAAVRRVPGSAVRRPRSARRVLDAERSFFRRARRADRRQRARVERRAGHRAQRRRAVERARAVGRRPAMASWTSMSRGWCPPISAPWMRWRGCRSPRPDRGRWLLLHGADGGLVELLEFVGLDDVVHLCPCCRERVERGRPPGCGNRRGGAAGLGTWVGWEGRTVRTAPGRGRNGWR